MIFIYQGDQFPITFSIENENGEYVADTDIYNMIFTVGEDDSYSIIKSYTDGDITYDSESKQFTIWLYEGDTINLNLLPYEAQLRVFFNDNYILSFDCGQLIVKECLAKEGEDDG